MARTEAGVGARHPAGERRPCRVARRGGALNTPLLLLFCAAFFGAAAGGAPDLRRPPGQLQQREPRPGGWRRLETLAPYIRAANERIAADEAARLDLGNL